MKKLLSVLLAALLVLNLAACAKQAPATEEPEIDVAVATPAPAAEEPAEDAPAAEVTYVRGDDEEAYENSLSGFTALNAAANAAVNPDERFVLFAQAEAYLLDSAVMIPDTTQGGAYAITRVGYRTIPYVQWGNDDDRWKSMVISKDLITKEEREEMKAMWEAAVAGEAEYDAKAYLESKGHEIETVYHYTFTTAPATIDWLNTSMQSDTEITVQTVDGLVEYNNLGQMQPALAESWDVSEDGTVYTFHIRKGVQWCTSEGTPYAEVTANDFVSGLRHMLDAQEGLEWLIDGIVVGGTDYYANGGSWENVGYKALDDYTLEVTLEGPTSYFLTMLTYSCFLPICTSFYEAHGGVFGVEEYAAASADPNTYTFGSADDVASQVYCGPFLLQKLVSDSEIVVTANPNYWDKDSVALTEIQWVYDNGENPQASYNNVVSGVYTGTGLSEANGTLAMAKEDGNFDKYSYITDTTSTTYFGGLNLNRGTFALESGACASPKTEQQKIDTNTAMQNKNFRKAVAYAFDKKTKNAVSRGEDLALTCLRNMYTHPEFVQLSADTADADGHVFPAGTMYGQMVQYYLDQMGCEVKVQDGIDGWFNPDAAKKYLEAAVAELGDTVTWPIQIDICYYSANDTQTAQAAAMKTTMEATLGADKIQVNMVEATTSDDYYASGYRAPDGISGNFDLFYGSGWGPDYGDPSTYLNTFLGEGAGYMTKVIGLF